MYYSRVCYWAWAMCPYLDVIGLGLARQLYTVLFFYINRSIPSLYIYIYMYMCFNLINKPIDPLPTCVSI